MGRPAPLMSPGVDCVRPSSLTWQNPKSTLCRAAHHQALTFSVELCPPLRLCNPLTGVQQRVWGVWRSEVKEEAQTQSGPGDTSEVRYPTRAAGYS